MRIEYGLSENIVIATRTFKTGDLVEIDANKGIVRKIEKN